MACIDVFHKGECTFPGADSQETGVCYQDPVSLFCATIISGGVVSRLGCTAQVLTVLLHSARTTLSLMTRPRLLWFSLISHGLSLTPGKSGFYAEITGCT